MPSSVKEEFLLKRTQGDTDENLYTPTMTWILAQHLKDKSPTPKSDATPPTS